MNAYYLDDRLSVAESTCQFSASGLRHRAEEEGFYVLAIRKSGYRECVFRFSEHDRAGARSMLETLNRSASKAGSGA